MTDTNNLMIKVAELKLTNIIDIIDNLNIHIKKLLLDQIISENLYFELVDKLKIYFYQSKKIELLLIDIIEEKDIYFQKDYVLDNDITKDVLDIKDKITSIHLELEKLVLDYGYNSLIELFNILLSHDILNTYQNEINKKLCFINKYYTIKKVNKKTTNSFKQVNMKIKDNNIDKLDKKDSKDLKELLEKDFSDELSINLIYEINKATIEIEIDDILYLIDGYFSEDSINQIFKNKMFNDKYKKIICNCIKSKENLSFDKKFKVFVNEYINQIPIKDYILKDTNDLSNEIIDSYIWFGKLTKLNILDVLNKFVDVDILEKRKIIILLLINDSVNNEQNDDDENELDSLFLSHEIKSTCKELSIFKASQSSNDSNTSKSDSNIIEKSKNCDSENKNKSKIENNFPLKMNKTTATKYSINSIMKNFDSKNEIKSFNSLIYSSKKLLNANVLLDFLRQNILKPEEYINFKNSIHHTIRRRIFAKEITESKSIKNKEELTYEMKVDLLDLEEKTKSKVLEKIKELRTSKENAKAESYIEGFFKIPFNKYIKEDVFDSCEKSNYIIKNLTSKINKLVESHEQIKSDYHIQMIKAKLSTYLENPNSEVAYLLEGLENQKDNLVKIKTSYLKKVDTILESAIYGHNDSKREIKRVIAQWMNGGDMGGTIIGFHGPPGVGKTVFAQKGIGKCLFDSEGKTRPFCIFQLGGASDGAVLEGHNYTYVGAKWGRLVEMLMDSKCMNPIIYFDELDKISSTDKGREIVDILIHLTDKSQNKEIYDRYFSGVELDFSKCIIIFSYNDVSKVDRILRDRITEIKINPLKKQEKIIITQRYTLKEISESVNTLCELNEKLIEYIIDTYTLEPGVRKLNEKLYEIFREINLRKLENPDLDITIDTDLIDEILTRHYKIRHYQIHKIPQIGLVNGLYASTIGLGGITLIQVLKSITSSNNLPLELTGQQGEVMKESMSCAKTLALRLLNDEQRIDLSKELKNNPFGLHIHCPDTSTPKDGPSAGITITTGIYSLLTNKPIRNDIAMTGEVDLLGNVKAIGGLDAKINGAIKAGVTKVLFPKENEQDYLKILENKSLDGNIECVMVENIQDVILHSIIN